MLGQSAGHGPGCAMKLAGGLIWFLFGSSEGCFVCFVWVFVLFGFLFGCSCTVYL